MFCSHAGLALRTGSAVWRLDYVGSLPTVDDCLANASGRTSTEILDDCAQIYGAVTLNNTLCLGVFLLIVHYKQLTWTYTSEVATLVGVPLLLPHQHVLHSMMDLC